MSLTPRFMAKTSLVVISRVGIEVGRSVSEKKELVEMRHIHGRSLEFRSEMDSSQVER